MYRQEDHRRGGVAYQSLASPHGGSVEILGTHFTQGQEMPWKRVPLRDKDDSGERHSHLFKEGEICTWEEQGLVWALRTWRSLAHRWMKWFSSRYWQPQAMSRATCRRSNIAREEGWFCGKTRGVPMRLLWKKDGVLASVWEEALTPLKFSCFAQQQSRNPSFGIGMTLFISKHHWWSNVQPGLGLSKPQESSRVDCLTLFMYFTHFSTPQVMCMLQPDKQPQGKPNGE